MQDAWTNGRPWLEIDHASGSMNCKWCIEIVSEKEHSFTWKSGKLETIKTHEISKLHIKSRDIKLGRNKSTSGEETIAMKSLLCLNEAVTNKLMHLFRNAHALALAGRPFTDFEWMARLDKKKGLDLGNTYLNSKRAKDFTDAIANVQLNDIYEQLQEASYTSIMSDGSTDASVTEVEIIYVRVCIKGEIKVRYNFNFYVLDTTKNNFINYHNNSTDNCNNYVI